MIKENKFQGSIPKIKHKLTKQEYQKYSGPSTGKFYRAAKQHKLPSKRAIENLPLRPIRSNIWTVSYQLAKYLPNEAHQNSQ